MFAVRCPSWLLWHPAVHHSMLLLRALKQPHTLVINPEQQQHRAGTSPTTFPLLFEYVKHVHITRGSSEQEASRAPGLTTVHCPDHILHFFPPDLPKLRGDLPAYLETSVVSSHVMSASDSLMVALLANDMETVRQTHAYLMELVERLDSTLEGEEGEQEAEPLSTWALYTTLQFLIEEGGLLTSAFPRVQKAYTRLHDRSKAVRLHAQLVKNTVDAFESSKEGGSPVDTTPVSLRYPHRGFLVETQRRLGEYTSSMEERVNDGVVGDKGPLASRRHGGRMGVQSVPATLPWTRQKTPLARR